MNADQQRFRGLMQDIDRIMSAALDLLPEHMVSSAKSSWYRDIMCALDNDSGFIEEKKHRMEDTLEEWLDETEDRT